MGPTQLFQLPSALKRSRPAAVSTPRHSDRRETKAEHILGVTEADINTARNKSINVAATNRVQGNLSDATTELGTSLPRDGTAPRLPELHLKASSVLLHDEFCDPSSASSVRSSRLKTYDSNSTLHSHYDASRAPLSVSQQTSDSSRRDFALRKGHPTVVKPPKPGKRLLPGLNFKASNVQSDVESRKLNNEWPRTGASHISVASSRPSARREPSTDSTSSHRVRFETQQPPTASPASKSTRAKHNLLEPLDPASVKVNVRKPKVGARHWFDGHEGDSSEEESIDEPAFDQNFVNGVELAFQKGSIKPPSDTSTITNTIISASLSSSSTPKSSMLKSARSDPPPPIPRIAVLNAKASKTSLRPTLTAKRKADPLDKTDLNKNSVLNLSSSDDEDEPITPQLAESVLSGPPIRDSVAILFSHASQVELGTAESIGVVPGGPKQPNVKYLKVSQPTKRGQIHMPIPRRSSSRMLSQLADQSEDDLIASFPATPVESVQSHGTSCRSSLAVSDAGSFESRRLMSVTKQEESLLAAMRLKKAAMRYHTTRDVRLQTLRNLERAQSRLSQMTDTSNHGFVSAQRLVIDTQPVPKVHKHRRSLSNDDRIFSRASGTTFATTITSRNPSRLSRLTLGTQGSADNITRLSLSSEASQDCSISPSLLSLSTADRRQRRDTFFSSSSAGQIGHARKDTNQSHVVALDELDRVPKRDEIPSQEFIDWPYKGWESRGGLGVAR